MAERDRLINELKKAKNRCLIHESGGCLACKYRGQADCTLENLADHLLENGVICPPCKVGQTVYIIENSDMLDIEPSVCSIIEDETYEMSFGKTQSGELKWLYLVLESGVDFYDTDIGKTVFLTKEEAEAKLKELGK